MLKMLRQRQKADQLPTELCAKVGLAALSATYMTSAFSIPNQPGRERRMASTSASRLKDGPTMFTSRF